MRNPVKGGFLYLDLAGVKEGYRDLLKDQPLVMDFYLNATEQVLVIKYNPAIGDERAVHSLMDA